MYRTWFVALLASLLSVAAAAGSALVVVCLTPGIFGRDVSRREPVEALVVVLVLAAVVGIALVTRRLALPDDARARLGGNAGTSAILCAVFSVLGAALAYIATFPEQYAHGRRLRAAGRLLLPALHPEGESEATGGDLPEAWVAEVPLEARAGLAAEWRQNARKEHAAIASFGQTLLKLMALGADDSLVAALHRDALDEVRHARLCFAVATALDGKRVRAAAFAGARGGRLLPGRRLGLVQVAIEALVDGALNEAVASRILARLAAHGGPLAKVLRDLAADEARHAAHSWDIVRWCVREGGPLVRAALRGAARALPRRMRGDLPPPARGGAWERWGVQGEALEAEEVQRAIARTRARLVAMSV